MNEQINQVIANVRLALEEPGISPELLQSRILQLLTLAYEWGTQDLDRIRATVAQERAQNPGNPSGQG